MGYITFLSIFRLTQKQNTFSSLNMMFYVVCVFVLCMAFDLVAFAGFNHILTL